MDTEKQRHRGRNGGNRERESGSQKDKRVSKKEKDRKGWRSDTDTELLMCNLLAQGGVLTYMEKSGAFLLKSEHPEDI